MMDREGTSRLAFVPVAVLALALTTRLISGYLWPDPGFIDYLPPIWERKGALSLAAMALGILALGLVAVPALRPSRRPWTASILIVALGFLSYEFLTGHYRFLWA